MDGRSLEIRFESIGGLGAGAAAEAVASAAVLKMEMNGALRGPSPPLRKGARARWSLRVGPAGRPMRGGPSGAVDAIVVLHAPLLADRQTLAGLREDGTLVYPGIAKRRPEALGWLPSAARAIRVDAAGIAMKEKCAPEAALVGALCAGFPLLAAEPVLAALCASFACGNSELVASIERAFARGAAELEEITGAGEAEGAIPARRASFPRPVSSVVGEPGNSAWNDLSWSRAGFLPVLNREQCIHCAMCDMVCPDLCLVWQVGEEGGRFQRELAGVDYRYCKGCMRCVETCPASAMLRKAETPGLAERQRVPLFDCVE